MNNPELLPETEIPPVEYPVITLEDAADAIERGGKFLILGHVNPDGDCVGSAYALAELIRACGGKRMFPYPARCPSG